MSAAALYANHKIDKRYIFDRKIPKEYGDPLDRNINGKLINGDRIIITDDVISTGLTKKNEVKLLNSLGINLDVVGVLVGLNRKETDENGNDPVKSLQEELGIPVYSILDSDSVFNLLHNKEFLGKVWVDDEQFQKFQDYRAKYGTK